MMPGKPIAARGKRFSPAELEAARRVRLPDVIADDLAVVFCGANPGLSRPRRRSTILARMRVHGPGTESLIKRTHGRRVLWVPGRS
jgi:hypothetical protein